jgi:peptidoglycan hydrolase-like protein with peptidoglycan-binding domain
MKKLMVLMLGIASIALITGCHKKETAEAPQQQPMLSEQQQPAAGAAMTATAVTEPVAPVATPVAAATSAVTQAANAAVEQVAGATATDNPTPQQIQQALKNMGLYAGKIDGSMGPKTKKAIEEFQSRNGLNPDGKVGPKTWAKLSTHLTGPASVATEPIMPADASATGTSTEVSN